MSPVSSRAEIVLLIALLACLVAAERGSAQTPSEELAQMTLEELMSVEVTTVSRTPELSARVPAALYVITPEAIRRSGATSLAEVLRMAPGLQVARIDAGKWSIGTRGFADRLARSMLVLVDGRAVYSPLFAGTYWETQDLVLDDIARIEVIRGPGGTLWGSNAVNGIINIITRSARDTQGLMVVGAAGTEDRVQGSIRYGGSFGERTFLRGYVTGFDRESQFNAGPLDYDGWRMAQIGFRLDSDVGPDRALTVLGDAYDARLGEFVRETSLAPPYAREYASDNALRGGHVLGRWSALLGTESDYQIQAYFDHSQREEYPVAERRRTLDVDIQLRHYRWARHDLVWGAGYRLTHGAFTTASTSDLPSGSETLVSGFAQDEISMAGDRLRATLGVKLERNDYSGLEVQPSGRVAWLPTPGQTVWAAVTRAVRRPSRVERMYASTSVLDPAAPAFVQLIPNPGFEPETLVSYELGYRVQPEERLYLRFAAFYNEWNDLLTTELLTLSPEPSVGTTYPVSFGNGLDGDSYGFELTGDLRASSWWTIAGHYALLRVRMTAEPGSTDLTQESRYERGSPRHQVHLRNGWEIPGGVSLDWHFRYVSELPDLDIDAYATSDVRVAWQMADELELEAVARNLHDDHHGEWTGENGGANVEIERSLYVGFIWRIPSN